MKYKYSIIIFFTFCTATVFAQTLSNKVFASGGSFSTAAWGSLSATTGEAVINTFPSANLILTQGFQQPVSGLTGLYAHDQQFKALLFPNPASSSLKLEISLPFTSTVAYSIFDINGKQVKVGEFNAEGGQLSAVILDVDQLSNGFYLLCLNHPDFIQNFKFQVNH